MGGGSSDTKTVNQTTKVELPAWVDDASQGNYKLASQIASQPYNPAASIKTVAGSNGLIDGSNTTLGYGIDKSHEMANAAQNANGALMGYAGPGSVAAGTVNAGQIGDTDLSKYLNPYLSSVVDASMSDLDNQRQKAITSNGAAASTASAFGGTRQAATDAMTNSDTARQAGLLSSQLRSAAFDKATGLATDDINRQFSADSLNANNALDAAKTNASNANAAAAIRSGAVANQNTLANSTVDNANKLATTQLYLGQNQRNMQQQWNDATQSNAGAQYQDQLNKLNVQLAALGMSPYGKTESTNGTTTSETSPDIGTMLLGGAKMGMGLFGK